KEGGTFERELRPGGLLNQTFTPMGPADQFGNTQVNGVSVPYGQQMRYDSPALVPGYRQQQSAMSDWLQAQGQQIQSQMDRDMLAQYNQYAYDQQHSN